MHGVVTGCQTHHAYAERAAWKPDDRECRKTSCMSLAFAEARAAQARGEVPIGASIVRDGEVIARAGNRTRADHDPTAHAEMLAIRAAAAALGIGAARPTAISM